MSDYYTCRICDNDIFSCECDNEPQGKLPECDPTVVAYNEGHAQGYHQAVADVVEWLLKENGLCDCHARSAGECGCGAWDDHKQWPLERTADEITQRFGKDALSPAKIVGEG